MKEKTKRTGRIPKLNPKTHCVMVRFDDEEHARFLTMYEQSGEYAKAVFIKARVFGEEFKVIRVDNSFPEYYAKLSDLHAQFRRIGVNYNQTVKELKSRFSAKVISPSVELQDNGCFLFCSVQPLEDGITKLCSPIRG